MQESVPAKDLQPGDYIKHRGERHCIQRIVDERSFLLLFDGDNDQIGHHWPHGDEVTRIERAEGGDGEG